MPYRLRDHLSYCVVDGHPIFLDVRIDRYFQLSPAMERAFITHLQAKGNRATDVSALLEHGILVDAPGAPDRDNGLALPLPTRSAVELTCSAKKAPASLVLEVLVTVCSTRIQLKTRRLKSILDGVIEHRRRLAPTSPPPEPLLLQTATEFRRARVVTPIAASCLLDSLALVVFLSRRHLCARIVFGVTREPFTAHCWVQAGTLALNETVGDAQTYTPILVL